MDIFISADQIAKFAKKRKNEKLAPETTVLDLSYSKVQNDLPSPHVKISDTKSYKSNKLLVIQVVITHLVKYKLGVSSLSSRSVSYQHSNLALQCLADFSQKPSMSSQTP